MTSTEGKVALDKRALRVLAANLLTLYDTAPSFEVKVAISRTLEHIDKECEKLKAAPVDLH